MPLGAFLLLAGVGSFQLSLVAMVTLATALPLGM
jgi:hypothetical protein